MTQPPRDWDREMAKIDRAMADQPPAAPAGRPVAIRTAGAPPPAAPPARVTVAPAAAGRARVATWMRVLLTIALGVGLVFWPYAKSCGLGLSLYLAAIAITGLSGVWAAFSAWHRRQGLAHLLALLVVAWTLALGAREVLPRIGYARQGAAWRCT